MSPRDGLVAAQGSALRIGWLEGAARERGVQVVAKTHGLEALDAIALSITGPPEDLVTDHLEQAEDDTQVRRVEGESLLRLRLERGLDVR